MLNKRTLMLISLIIVTCLRSLSEALPTKKSENSELQVLPEINSESEIVSDDPGSSIKQYKTCVTTNDCSCLNGFPICHYNQCKCVYTMDGRETSTKKEDLATPYVLKDAV